MRKIFVLAMASLLAAQHGYSSGAAQGSVEDYRDVIGAVYTDNWNGVFDLIDRGGLNSQERLQVAGMAIQRGNIDVLKKLRDRGISVAKADMTSHLSALNAAVRTYLTDEVGTEKDNMEIINFLLESGADPNDKRSKECFSVYELLNYEENISNGINVFLLSKHYVQNEDKAVKLVKKRKTEIFNKLAQFESLQQRAARVIQQHPEISEQAKTLIPATIQREFDIGDRGQTIEAMEALELEAIKESLGALTDID